MSGWCFYHVMGTTSLIFDWNKRTICVLCATNHKKLEESFV